MKIDRSKISELLNNDLSDEEIASRLNCSSVSIRDIRGELHIKKKGMDSWRKVGVKFKDKKLSCANLTIPGIVLTRMFPELLSRPDLKLLFKIWPYYPDMKIEITFKRDDGIHISDDGTREPEKRTAAPGAPYVATINKDELRDNAISLPTLKELNKRD